MHSVKIKGASGLMAFMALIVGLVLLAVGVPALFMMVVWNALVFEAFHGPAIGLHQGVLLWLAMLIGLKLALRPYVSFQFHKVRPDSPEANKRLDP